MVLEKAQTIDEESVARMKTIETMEGNKKAMKG